MHKDDSSQLPDIVGLLRQVAGDRADYVMVGITAGMAIGLLAVALVAAAAENGND